MLPQLVSVAATVDFCFMSVAANVFYVDVTVDLNCFCSKLSGVNKMVEGRTKIGGNEMGVWLTRMV